MTQPFSDSATMDDKTDVQGVLRGKCTICHCSQYFGGEKRLKCEHCKHPPSKHENLSANPRRATDAGWSAPSYSQMAAGSHNQGHGGYSGLSHQAAMHHYSALPQRTCKACPKPVHYEPDVGEFDYCSPTCRDNDMLEEDRRKLKRELQRLAKKLCESSKSSTTPTPSPKESSVRSPKGTAKQQITREVYFQKPADREFGMIVFDKLYSLELIRGFLVTGVEVRSMAYEMLKKKELRLLGVITSVNNTPVEGLNRPVDEELKRSRTANFELNCTIAIECSSSLFTNVEKLKATHIIVLMNPNQFGRTEFGFEVKSTSGREGLMVAAVRQGTVARHSGLMYDDSILSYVMATKESIEAPKLSPHSAATLEFKMREASKEGKHVILVINRR